MSFELPENARAWQAKVRAFVEAELIPYEVEAEMNGGVLPDAVTRRHGEAARELGLSAMDVPEERGGLARTPWNRPSSGSSLAA
jgi:alkylation response protein AidB-like acyl-CoA dehydrogenase